MRRLLLSLAAAAAAVAVLVAVSGGARATVGGLRVSAQSPLTPAIAAAVLALAWLMWARRDHCVTSDLDAWWLAIDRRADSIVVLIAFASGAAALVFGTYSAAGADASGYLSQAAMLASGALKRLDSLGVLLQGADIAAFVTTPLGWRPSAPGLQVPSYPPGLPMLMAIPEGLFGGAGAFLVIPLASGLAVWSVGTMARTMAGTAAGIVASLMLAVAPVFVFQSVQPMSDVPVTAAWMLCWLFVLRSRPAARLRQGCGAGVACAVAVLIRPNLGPLAAVPLIHLWRSDRRAAITFALPVIVAAIAIAWLQWYWYGSPLRSGYGGAGELFTIANAWPNLVRYAGWFVDTNPIMLAGVCALWMLPRDRFTQALAAFVLLNLAAYLVYAVFEDWSYLRFLLPALAIAAVYSGVCLGRLIEKQRTTVRGVALTTIALLIFAAGAGHAREREAFRLADQQRRVAQTATALLARMDPDDVIVAGEQSGSMRYYTRHDIVRWDELAEAKWDRVLAALDANNRRVWIVLDAFEEPLFRTKFGAHAGGGLDWPPVIDAGDTHRTRAWRLSDRAGFLRGAPVPTDRIR